MTAGPKMVLLPMDDPSQPLHHSGLPSAMIRAGGDAFHRLKRDHSLVADSCSLAVGIYRAMTEAHAKEIATLTPPAALASPRADGDERTAGETLKEACKPWEHYTGEPPDDGSPLSGVFVAGMFYTERLLAKLLDVTHYEGGDGSEDFDSDATQTLRNILTGARLWDADENRPISATPAQPAGAVPDGLRALSEAATQGEWYTESEKCDGSYGSGEDCGEGYLAYSILTDAEPRYGNPGVIAETSNSTLGVIHEESDEDGFTAWDETARTNTAFIVAAVNFVRTLLASHPAGQSAGSGAETDALVDRFSAALKVKLRAAEAKYGWKNGWLKSNWQVECQNGLLRHVGKGDPLDVAAYAAFCWHHGWPSASRRSTDFVTGAVIPTAGAIAAYETRYPEGSLSETSDNAIEAWNRVAAAVCLAEKPAPDSTRTDQVGVAVEQAVAKAAERAVEQLENAASGGLFHCEADREEAVEIVTEAIWTSPLAARPAAPEAQ
jgi:hypothetical protein